MDRIHPRNGGGDDRVPRLVIRDDLALLLAHDALLLETRDEPIDRLVEVLRLDGRLILARRKQRGLVHQVREVCAGEAGRPSGDDFEIDVRRKLHVPGVDA